MFKTLKIVFLAGAMAAVASTAYAEPVKVAVGAEPYAPFSSQDASGKWVGWEIEMMEAVCAEAKLECELTPVAWDGIIPALTSGKIDAIFGSMSITEERMKTIDFSDKYYNTPAILTIAKGSGLKPTNESLKGKTVGVQVSTTHAAYAKKHFTDATIKEYQTQDEVNQDLAAGRIDATNADGLAQSDFLKTDAGKACCEDAGTVPDDEAVLGAGVGVGLRKDSTELKEKFNAAIKAVRENGKYEEISKKYFDFDIYGSSS